MTFDEIYSSHFEEIYRFTYRFLGNAEKAEDITQDAFTELVRQMNGSAEIRNPRAWLYKVAANLAKNLIRRGRQYRDILEEKSRHPDEIANPEEHLEQTEQKQLLFRALADLPVRDQVLIQLYKQGLTYREIAEIAEIKETSVGKMLSRAIDKCANKIKQVI